ncbi:DUF7288 family protein [Methanocella sp. MCL-LM]|uniref:DUF7288 family protein n=1 Tax=Methanocella sp. MCL-LM TaxID=3412035 RepID=UPI003C78C06F
MKSKTTHGQIYTLEGVIAAVVVVGLLIFIIQSISVVSPQTEMTSNMKLLQKASDTLICLDRLNETNTSELKSTISGWNGTLADYETNLSLVEMNISLLDEKIRYYLTPDGNYSDIYYNVEIFYHNDTGDHRAPLIVHGKPGDNSVVASRLITINSNEKTSSFWAESIAEYSSFPQVVEVRLISWYL